MNSASPYRFLLGLTLCAFCLSSLCAQQSEAPPKETPKTGEKSPDKAAEKSSEKSGDSDDETKTQNRTPSRPRSAPSANDSLRLDVGGGGLLLGAPESGRASGGISGGTSLGPLPDFKNLSIGQSPAETEPEEPAFPDIAMRRRARPELLPDGPNATEEAAVALRDRIRFRSVKTQALRDPAVREALEASVKARSERAMREALERHYTLLYARMRVLDGSLKELISQRETEALEKLRERLPR